MIECMNGTWEYRRLVTYLINCKTYHKHYILFTCVEDDTNNGHFAVDVKIEEGGGAFNVQVKEDEGGKQSEDRDPSVIGALLQSLTRSKIIYSKT